MSELAVICPACRAALAAWERGGHHLSCRACEVRAVAGGSIAARAAFYGGLLQMASREEAAPRGCDNGPRRARSTASAAAG